MKAVWIALALSACVAEAGDWLGTYRGSLEREGRTHEVRARILAQPGGRLELRLEARGLGRLRFEGGDCPDEVVFRRGAGGTSLSGALVGAPKGPSASLTLRRAGEEFLGAYEATQGPPATLRLTRERRALIVYAQDPENPGDTRVFAEAARSVAAAYQRRGYAAAEVQPCGSVCDVVTLLQNAADLPLSRVVFVGHGGWDGPFFGPESPSQVSNRPVCDSNQPVAEHVRWGEFTQALRRGTTADAQVYASACHTGGSNRYEAQGFLDTDDPVNAHYAWSRELARATGRIVAGPAGTTNSAWGARQVEAVLEGRGTVIQQTHWCDGHSERTLPPGKRLADVAPHPIEALVRCR
ncbi:MAG: hypothetical protein R3F62_20880 [Planctomycetota bacterium]